MMSADHWMTFGTFAQKDYFEFPRMGTYEGVLINGNMAAHAPAGLSALLLEKTARASYIIDPITHAFQHDPAAVTNKDGEPKKSVKSLAEAYGEPVANLVGQRPLLPEHLDDSTVLSGFVERCIRFQSDHIRSFMPR